MKSPKLSKLMFFLSIFLLFVSVDIFARTVSALASGETFTVTSNADSGPGTLRQALQDSQNSNTIIFDTVVFPPGNPETIFFVSTLPQLIQGNLIIDASNSGIYIYRIEAGKFSSVKKCLVVK
jgi:hypothetical protein